MFCTRCGRQMPDDAMFCPNCGKAKVLNKSNTDKQNWQNATTPASTVSQTSTSAMLLVKTEQREQQISIIQDLPYAATEHIPPDSSDHMNADARITSDLLQESTATHEQKLPFEELKPVPKQESKSKNGSKIHMAVRGKVVLALGLLGLVLISVVLISSTGLLTKRVTGDDYPAPTVVVSPVATVTAKPTATVQPFTATPRPTEATVSASGTCGENLTWSYSNGTLTIQGTGRMEGAPWNDYRNVIHTVIINNGVTSISMTAFRECSSLTSVTIPGSVISIGVDAFANCRSLTYLEISEGVTEIPICAFYGCSSLTSVTIPDGVTSIGESAFADCSSLTNVTIPDSITSIGGEAFSRCGNLTSVAIPDSVTFIGENAFDDCSNLTDVYYGGGEKQWEKIKIRDINLNDPLPNVTIHYNSTGAVTGGTCGANLTWSLSTDGTLTISGTGPMDGYGYYDMFAEPDSPWIVHKWSTGEELNITSVVLENGVTSIGTYAFGFCRNLTNVIIPNSVTSIGNSAFDGCSNLTSITIPASITSIEYGAFDGCSSLTNIYYGGSENQWNQIYVNNAESLWYTYHRDNYLYENGNDYLLNATIHYNGQRFDSNT